MPGGEDNSLDSMAAETTAAPPCVFVLFGATGDLAARKIAPALYNLAADGLLGDNFAVLGVARRPRSDEQFRGEMLDAVRKYSRRDVDEKLWSKFAARWHYHVVRMDHPDEFKSLADRLAGMDKQYGTCGGRIFYLAVPPNLFDDIVGNMQAAGLNKPGCDGGFVRVVVEKPFGRDLESACRLNKLLLGVFDERRIFRIDHYLGKEIVQNIVVFRWANAIFEPLLSNRYVDDVRITAAETVGMEGRRGAYYETAGALRDMVQNHMLQLLALTTMEPPAHMGEAIRDAKASLLRAVRPLSPDEVARCTVRGQYDGGKGVAAYREENGVATDSQVETFAAVKLLIDNPRWSGVPFYLRTGKRLAAKASEICITFKREPMGAFRDAGCDFRSPNKLTIRMYPDEGINITFDAKVPGAGMLLRPVKMDFSYGSTFQWASPEAYERIVLDAIAGDSSLFIRTDEVEASWRVIDSIRRAWDSTRRPKLVHYAPGSWGPEEANLLFEDSYKHW